MNAREPDVIFSPSFADYSLLETPYQPRNNEVMGERPELKRSGDPYQYNPISYKTPSRSYFDSWSPIEHITPYQPTVDPRQRPFNTAEHFQDMRFSFDSMLIMFLFVLVVVFSYFQQKQIDCLSAQLASLRT